MIDFKRAENLAAVVRSNGADFATDHQRAFETALIVQALTDLTEAIRENTKQIGKKVDDLSESVTFQLDMIRRQQ